LFVFIPNCRKKEGKLKSSAISCYGLEPPSEHTSGEAQRAKSSADFSNKIQGGLQELEESIYWLEPAILPSKQSNDPG
jgi:hypothetical protein